MLVYNFLSVRLSDCECASATCGVCAAAVVALLRGLVRDIGVEEVAQDELIAKLVLFCQGW